MVYAAPDPLTLTQTNKTKSNNFGPLSFMIAHEGFLDFGLSVRQEFVMSIFHRFLRLYRLS